MEENSRANRLTIILLVIYLIALFWIIVMKLNIQFSAMGSRSVNLIPYGEPLLLNGKVDFGEMILNVLIFMPLGIYTSILFKRWVFGRQLISFFMISLLFEVLQFILRVGAFDITDIINNTLGGILGFLLYKGIEKVFSNSVKAQRFVNIIAATGTTLVIVSLVLLKLNHLWMFRM